MRKRLHSTALAVVDLTESDLANGTEQETENFPPDECQFKKENLNKSQTSSKQDFNLQKSSPEDAVVFAPQQDCGNIKPKLRRLNSQTQNQKQTSEAHACHHRPAVKLKRLPFLETHFKDLEASRCSVYLTKDCTQMSLCFRQPNNNSETPECISNLRMTALNGPHMEHSLTDSPSKVVESPGEVQQENCNEFTSAHLDEKNSQHLQSPADSPHSDEVSTLKEYSTCEDKTGDFCSSVFTPSPISPSSQHKAQGFIQREVLSSNTEQLELDKAESRRGLSDLSSPSSPNTRPNSCMPFDLKSLSPLSPVSPHHKSQVDPTSTSEHAQVKNTSNSQLEKSKADGASNSPECLYCTTPSEPALSVSKTEDMDEGSGTGTYRGDVGIDSPVSFLWQEGSDGEDWNEDSQFEMHFRAASTEDRNFVCPVTLRKMMSGPAQALVRHSSYFLYMYFFCVHMNSSRDYMLGQMCSISFLL